MLIAQPGTRIQGRGFHRAGQFKRRTSGCQRERVQPKKGGNRGKIVVLRGRKSYSTLKKKGKLVENFLERFRPNNKNKFLSIHVKKVSERQSVEHESEQQEGF